MPGLLEYHQRSKHRINQYAPGPTGLDWANQPNPFREFDVLTRVGGHDIDNQGMVSLPGGLRIPFQGMIPRLARGNAVPVTMLREGKPVRVRFTLGCRDLGEAESANVIGEISGRVAPDALLGHIFGSFCIGK